ncbi:MAG: FtsQ-type POTRA domain-containing protein [Deltaproteobacteria bacterium]|nr:FtsQ-type POTRA domain-containing protein [Deltaproteobacteria bacterium]
MRKPQPRERSSITGRHRIPEKGRFWSRLARRVSRPRADSRRFSVANQTIDSKRARRRPEREDSIRGQSPVPRSTATPRERAIAVSGIAIVAGSSALVALGVRDLHHYLSSSADFAIAKISINGIERASEGEILELAGVDRGQNYFTVDPIEVAARVSSHPWVREVRVRTELPSSVVIDVEEHVPVVMAALGHLYYATAEGELVKRRTSLDGETFPVVTGLEKEKLEAGDVREKERLLVGIAFVSDSQRVLGVESAPLAEVHVDEMKAVSFMTANDATRVFAGAPPWDERLLRVGRVRSELKDRGLVARDISLGSGRRAERVVARLARAEPPKALVKKRADTGVSAKRGAAASSGAIAPQNTESSHSIAPALGDAGRR